MTERMLVQEIPTSSAVVAFYAYMSKSQRPVVVIPHHVHVFDVVRTNVDNAYHSSTGVFTVPQSGVYVFIWSFLNSAFYSTQLMINTEDWWGGVHTHSGMSSTIQSTSVVVAHVNKGDDVFVKNSGLSSSVTLNNDWYGITMFTGWKLH